MLWILDVPSCFVNFHQRPAAQEIKMSEFATAKIIPFPVRQGASVTLRPMGLTPGPSSPKTPAATAPTQAEIRLSRALTDLNQAVLTQRIAMAAWKAALGDLRIVTRRLGTNLRSYNEGLSRLDARVNTLRAEAVKLEAWADEAISRKG
jgi:hypothetical protein